MKRLISILLLLSVLLAGCGSTLERGKQVRMFSFTDQNGNSFGSEQLAGGPWIADFVFTSCNTICPSLTAEMTKLQTLTKEKGIDVDFVSFTVDPEVDHPAKLKEYLSRFTDEESNWHMLTGYTQAEIEAFAREEFQTFVLKHESSTQVVHGTNFYLLDSEGYIIKEYNFSDESYREELMNDLKRLK